MSFYCSKPPTPLPAKVRPPGVYYVSQITEGMIPAIGGDKKKFLRVLQEFTESGQWDKYDSNKLFERLGNDASEKGYEYLTRYFMIAGIYQHLDYWQKNGWEKFLNFAWNSCMQQLSYDVHIGFCGWEFRKCVEGLPSSFSTSLEAITKAEWSTAWAYPERHQEIIDRCNESRDFIMDLVPRLSECKNLPERIPKALVGISENIVMIMEELGCVLEKNKYVFSTKGLASCKAKIEKAKAEKIEKDESKKEESKKQDLNDMVF